MFQSFLQTVSIADVKPRSSSPNSSIEHCASRLSQWQTDVGRISSWRAGVLETRLNVVADLVPPPNGAPKGILCR